MDDYKRDLIGYYAKEYRKFLPAVKDEQLNAQIKQVSGQFSSVDRFIVNIQNLKLMFLFEKTSLICTVFKVSLVKGEQGEPDGMSSIYGYLYSRVVRGKIEHRYVCCSPTFNSQDGEYRHRVIPYKQLMLVKETYVDEFDFVESYLLEQINSGELLLSTDIFYPHDINISEKKFEDSINEGRIAITIFIAAWLCDFYNIHTKIMENHINASYQYIIYRQNGISIFEQLMKKMGENNYFMLRYNISKLGSNKLSTGKYRPFAIQTDINKKTSLRPIECGQKIIPMTQNEILEVGNINFSVWREIYIETLCSNLSVNFICPSFHVPNNWFLIQNSHPGMYDNLPMHNKYTHGEVAEEINKQLKNIDNKAFVSPGTPINSKFQKLSNKINNAIEYSESSLVLTDMSICITGEYVGRTFRDLPILAKSDLEKDRMFYPTIFRDVKIFAKHLFEIIYSSFCMNTKVGIFHGDLHLNNATVFNLYDMFWNGKCVIDRPKVLYVIGDEPEKYGSVDVIRNNGEDKDVASKGGALEPSGDFPSEPDVKTEAYVFDHIGIYSMLIDFSRAIIGNKQMLEKDFGIEFADNYFRKQHDRVLRILFHYFPKFTEKYKDKLRSLMIENFQIVFKIVSVIDAYSLARNLKVLLAVENLNHDPAAETLLGRIELLSERLILGKLKNAFDRKITTVTDFTWPNLEVIRECFSDYKYAGGKIPGTVVDVFSYANEVKYHIEEYDTSSPLIKFDEDIRLRKKYNLPTVYEDFDRYDVAGENTLAEALSGRYAEKYGPPPRIQESSWMLE